MVQETEKMDRGNVERIMNKEAENIVKQFGYRSNAELSLADIQWLTANIKSALANKDRLIAEKDARIKELEGALKDRNIEWWKELALVDNVAPNPKAVKEWLMILSKHEIEQATKEKDAEIERLKRLVKVWEGEAIDMRASRDAHEKQLQAHKEALRVAKEALEAVIKQNPRIVANYTETPYPFVEIVSYALNKLNELIGAE